MPSSIALWALAVLFLFAVFGPEWVRPMLIAGPILLAHVVVSFQREECETNTKGAAADEEAAAPVACRTAPSSGGVTVTQLLVAALALALVADHRREARRTLDETIGFTREVLLAEGGAGLGGDVAADFAVDTSERLDELDLPVGALAGLREALAILLLGQIEPGQEERAVIERALEELRAAGEEDRDSASYLEELYRATLLRARDRYEEGWRALDGLVRRWSAEWGATSALLLPARHQLFLAQIQSGRYAEAEALYPELALLEERNSGEDSDAMLVLHANYASLLRRTERFAEAVELCERALAGLPEAPGGDRRSTRVRLALRSQYMASLLALRRREEAREPIASLARDMADYYGSDHPRTAEVIAKRAELDWALGDLELAAERIEDALEVLEGELAPDHPVTLQARALQVHVLIDQGRCGRSTEIARALYQGERGRTGEGSSGATSARFLLARSLACQGELAEAEGHFRRVLELGRRFLPPASARLCAWRRAYAALLGTQGRRDEALALLRRSQFAIEAAGAEREDYALALEADIEDLEAELAGDG